MKKCYPFLSGVLESSIRYMSYGNVPGIKVTDAKKFEEYLMKEIENANKAAEKYAAEHPEFNL